MRERIHGKGVENRLDIMMGFAGSLGRHTQTHTSYVELDEYLHHGEGQ